MRTDLFYRFILSIFIIGAQSAFAEEPKAKLEKISKALLSGRYIDDQIIRTLFEDPLDFEMKKYLNDYEAEMLKVKPVAISTRQKVFHEALSKDLILFGEEHDNLTTLSEFSHLLEYLSVKNPIRNRAYVSEFVKREHQIYLDQYIEGLISLEELKVKIDYDNGLFKNFQWKLYSMPLVICKKYKIKIVAAHTELDYRDLFKRDLTALQSVSEYVKSNPNNQIVVFYGSAHLFGKNHLGDMLLSQVSKNAIFINSSQMSVNFSVLPYSPLKHDLYIQSKGYPVPVFNLVGKTFHSYHMSHADYLFGAFKITLSTDEKLKFESLKTLFEKSLERTGVMLASANRNLLFHSFDQTARSYCQLDQFVATKVQNIQHPKSNKVKSLMSVIRKNFGCASL